MRAADTLSLPADLIELADWHRAVRAQFPQIVGSAEAYLDSSATSQKPISVLDEVMHYLTTGNANAGRGSYPWANRTTAMIEQAREDVKAFLDDPAPDRSTVSFVGGATEGLRRVAEDWLAEVAEDGDEIVIPLGDHLANAVPWHAVVAALDRRGVRVAVHAMPYEPSGDYDIAALARLVGPRTRLVAATHVHHVYGVDMNVHRIRPVVPAGTILCLDAAQSIGHLEVSTRDVDVDFVVFSGHKAMALPGIGAVWARNLRTPGFTPSGWSGSPNTAGVVSLAAALAWLRSIDVGRIDRWTTGLGAVLTHGLSELPSIEVLGCQASLRRESDVQRRQGIVTFRHRRIPGGDLGFHLESHGFLVRADHHCQAGAGRAASIRVSTHAYTSVDEVLALLDTLHRLEEEQAWQL